MKDILIVIDMQDGFVIDYKAERLVGKIEALLDKRIFDAVIATKFINKSNSMFRKLLDWHALETQEDIALSGRIAYLCDREYEKDGYGIPPDGSFEALLCGLNDNDMPSRVFLCGLDTDACVLAMAMDLFERGVRPIVLADYCVSESGDEYHEAGLKCMESTIGARQIYRGEISSKADLDI